MLKSTNPFSLSIAVCLLLVGCGGTSSKDIKSGPQLNSIDTKDCVFFEKDNVERYIRMFDPPCLKKALESGVSPNATVTEFGSSTPTSLMDLALADTARFFARSGEGGKYHPASLIALLWDAGADPNAVLMKSGQTPLELALHLDKDDAAIKEYILTHPKVDVNLKSRGLYPLEIAIQKKSHQDVEVLIRRKVNVNLKSGVNSPLRRSITSSQEETALALIHAGAEFRDDSPNQWSLLMHCVSASMHRCRDALLSKGANVNFISDEGIGVLHIALGIAGAPSMGALLAANPVVESDSFVKNSPLLVAIQNNYWNWVEALLQRGAKANKVFEQGTVLHYPMSADWIRRLVAEGAPLQVMYRGESPLSQAVKNNNTESALTLLSLNAPVRSPELDALHLLHRATHWGNIEVVKALLNGGAELDALDNRLRTALGVAMLRVPSNEAQFAPLVLELIARGSKLDHSSADTGPLLHRAASFSSTQILSAMLDKGARIETLDGSGNSAYVNASLANAKFLGTRGLRFDIRNSKQQSVIAVLLRMGRKSKLPILSWLYEQRAHVGDLSLQELRPYHYVLRNEPYSADDEKIEDYLKFLKDVGFDPNVLDRGSDPLALQYPWALQRDPALTSLFIELGAQIHATMPPSGRWNKPYSFADVLQLEVRDMEQEIAAVKNRGDNDLAQKLERLYRGPIALRRELLNLIANAP